MLLMGQSVFRRGVKIGANGTEIDSFKVSSSVPTVYTGSGNIDLANEDTTVVLRTDVNSNINNKAAKTSLDAANSDISDLQESVADIVGWTIEITDSGDSIQFSYGTNSVKLATGSASYADITAPTVLDIEVGNHAADTIVMLMSENMDNDSVPATTAFSVTTSLGNGSAVIGAVRVNNDSVFVGLDSAIIENEVVTLSYTRPASGKLQDTSGNLLSNLSNRSVNVNVSATTDVVALYTFENETVNYGVGSFTLVESETGLTAYNGTAPEGSYSLDLNTHYHLKTNDEIPFSNEWTLSAYINAGESVQRGLFSVDGYFQVWVDYGASTTATDNIIETRTIPGGLTLGASSTIAEPFEYDDVFISIRYMETAGTYYMTIWCNGVNVTSDSVVGQNMTSIVDTFRLGYVFPGGEGFSDIDAFSYYPRALSSADLAALYADPGNPLDGDHGDDDPPGPLDIIGIGNSIVNEATEAYGLLDDESGYNVTNIAGAGDRIANQLTAWNALADTVQQAADYVLVMIGINDIAHDSYPVTAAYMFADYTSFISQINSDISSTCKIICFSLCPADDAAAMSSQDEAEWDSFNNWLENTFTGWDIFSSANTDDLNDGTGALASAYDSGDGIHPNAAGQQVILQNLKDAIDEYDTEVLFNHDFDNLGLYARGAYNPTSDATWHSVAGFDSETVNNLAIVDDGSDTVFAQYYDEGHVGLGSGCDTGGGDGTGTYFSALIKSAGTRYTDVYMSYNYKTSSDFHVGVRTNQYMEMKYPGLEATDLWTDGASVRPRYSNYASPASQYYRWYNKLYGDSWSATEPLVGTVVDSLITDGNWHNITIRVSTNSSTSSPNGIVEFFHDGVLTGSVTGLNISNLVGIDKLEWSTATGGCGQDAILMEMEADHYIYYDDLVVWRYKGSTSAPGRGETSASGRDLSATMPTECEINK